MICLGLAIISGKWYLIVSAGIFLFHHLCCALFARRTDFAPSVILSFFGFALPIGEVVLYLYMDGGRIIGELETGALKIYCWPAPLIALLYTIKAVYLKDFKGEESTGSA